MKTKRRTHMAFFENGDYWMCECEHDDVHNVEDELRPAPERLDAQP